MTTAYVLRYLLYRHSSKSRDFFNFLIIPQGWWQFPAQHSGGDETLRRLVPPYRIIATIYSPGDNFVVDGKEERKDCHKVGDAIANQRPPVEIDDASSKQRADRDDKHDVENGLKKESAPFDIDQTKKKGKKDFSLTEPITPEMPMSS